MCSVREWKTLPLGSKVTAVTVNEDFFFSGLGPGDTSNPLGSKVAAVTVNEILGLNSLGIYILGTHRFCT